MAKRSNKKGRKRGTKNLVRKDGLLINQKGVAFTLEEKRALENKVRQVNRKRKEMQKIFGVLPRKVGGKETGDTVSSLQFMDKESDFILSRKTSSLQRFESRKEFEQYMRNLERVNHPNYINERGKLYKRNYLRTLRENYAWDDIKDIYMKIQTMPQDKYMREVTSNEELEIGFLPSDDSAASLLNPIRAALGLKEKDEWFDEELF